MKRSLSFGVHKCEWHICTLCDLRLVFMVNINCRSPLIDSVHLRYRNGILSVGKNVISTYCVTFHCRTLVINSSLYQLKSRTMTSLQKNKDQVISSNRLHENSNSSFGSPSLKADTEVSNKDQVVHGCQNEDCNLEFVFQQPPDVTFIVEGIEFPCHLKILTKDCAILRDIVFFNGIQKRLSKKQRMISRAQNGTCKLLLPSSTTRVELQNVDHKIFRALLEFLYTNKVPPELYWEIQDESSSSSLEGDSNTDDDDSLGEEIQDQSIYRAMGFLQRLLIAADQYGMVSLKHRIEYVLHDEFLYSFTSAELFVWADAHSCAFLKEKAMDRICKKNSLVDDFTISNDGWTMIRQSKRLLEELFLYARYAPRVGHSIGSDNKESSGYKIDELNYYKVEHLRSRLSDLGLDIDGTRKMLEERLRPHLDANHCQFLPTKLTKLLSEKGDVQRSLHEEQQQSQLNVLFCCSEKSSSPSSSCSE